MLTPFVLLLSVLVLLRAETETNRLYKVAMTQKGYIQFMKYKVDVPPLKQFTFCLWIKCEDFSHAQPLFSYSKNQRDRYIRSRITENGRLLKISLMEQEFAQVRVQLKPHSWHHVCLSWDSNIGRWQVYLDGILKATGINRALRGAVIPGGGDIVIGQEYTDFDKGLDDGVEGEIFGFNMILSSATEEPNHRYYHRERSFEFQTEPAIGRSEAFSDYIKLQDLSVNRKPDNLRLVTEDYYNVDVDYTTFAPEEFKSADYDVEVIDEQQAHELLLKPPPRSSDRGFADVESLPLNNLPVYQTPPGDSVKPKKPSFERLYSWANFKGNEWYGRRSKSKPSRRPKPKKGRVNDEYPYPSENVYVVHRVRRESKQKNVEILNPDSILIYPGRNDILDVEVYPRGEVSDNDKSDTPYGEASALSYEVAYAKQHYTGGTFTNTKRFPHNIRDKIEGHLGNSSSEATNAKFTRPVKLGNALNEVEIFRRHGNDRIRSFVDEVESVPHVDEYRSDIDDASGGGIRAVHDNKKREKRPKSAGKKLIELSFKKCLLNGGSPLAGDPASLVDWNLTPMKLFGGTVLKMAAPTCGRF